jgi:hypothetical protein
MAITSMTRFKSDNSEEMVKTARQAKAIVEKHGAEFFRVSRFHTAVEALEDSHAGGFAVKRFFRHRPWLRRARPKLYHVLTNADR